MKRLYRNLFSISALTLGAIGVADAQCTWTLDETDTWGDGWNGNVLEVSINGTPTNFSMAGGSTATETFSVNDGDVVVVTYLGGGSFNSEVGWTLTDNNGNVLTTVGSNPSAGFTYWEGVVSCNGTCPYPTNLTSPTQNLTDADLSWTTNGTETTWYVEYGPSPLTPGTGTTLTLTTGDVTISGTTVSYNLAGLNNSTNYDVYVSADCGGSNSHWDLDAFTTLNPCPDPSGLTVTAIQHDSVAVSWTAGSGGETEWNIEYGPAGFTPGSGTAVDVFVDPNDTIAGLMANTAYDFYVQAVCSASDSSFYVGPVTVTTPCAVEVAPWTESFDAPNIPDCWAMSGPEPWLFSSGWPNYGAGSIWDHTGNNGNSAGVDGSSGTNFGVILETPMIDVSALTVPALEFYYFSNNIDNPGDNNTLNVEVWDGAAWNTVRTIAEDNPNWVKHTIILGTLTITGDVQVRFVVDQTAGTAFYNDQIIDDVSILEAPSCPDPYGLMVNVNADTAFVSFTAGYLETTWNVEYGAVGYTPGTGTSSSTMSNPDTITGLSLGSVYDFYVQADCGGGDESTWVGPVTVATDVLNDTVCDAVSVPVDGTTYYYSNIGATTEVNEFTLSNPSNNTVWFKATVPSSGHMAIATCDASFDTELAVYADTLTCSDFSTFGEIAYADWNPWGCSGSHPAGVELCGLTPGDDVWFYVGSGTNGNTGIIPLRLWDLGIEAGTGSEVDACASIDTLDLTGLVSGTNSPSPGVFEYTTNSTVILDDTMAVAGNFTLGNNEVLFIVDNSCMADTAIITVNVATESYSGDAVDPFMSCNTDVFLPDGLTGVVDNGGTWTDDSGTGLLAGSNGNTFVAADVPAGTYPFTYTVDNGVCPPSSTTVTVTISDCSGVDENGAMITMYPNPNNGSFFILSDVSGENNVVITDISGKVVYNNVVGLSAGNPFEIMLDNVEAGMYMINISNASGSKVMNMIIK